MEEVLIYFIQSISAISTICSLKLCFFPDGGNIFLVSDCKPKASERCLAESAVWQLAPLCFSAESERVSAVRLNWVSLRHLSSGFRCVMFRFVMICPLCCLFIHSSLISRNKSLVFDKTSRPAQEFLRFVQMNNLISFKSF